MVSLTHFWGKILNFAALKLAHIFSWWPQSTAASIKWVQSPLASVPLASVPLASIPLASVRLEPRSAIKRLLPSTFLRQCRRPVFSPLPGRDLGRSRQRWREFSWHSSFFFSASIFGMDRTRRLGPKGGEGMFEALVWGSWRRRDLLSGGGTDVRYRRGEG